MMQLSDAQIHSIRQQISRQVAFPEEMSSSFDEAQARDFLRDVAACQTEEELQSMTTLLPRRRLNDLFGALLIVSAAEGEELVLKLLYILKQRITPSLAEIGWAFFQNHFPNDRMNRVLSAIISGIADKVAEIPYLRAVAAVADLPIIDDLLPARMAMRLQGKTDILLSNVMVELTILPDSAFAANFLANFFAECPDEVLENNTELFIHALTVNDRDVQVSLIKSYLQKDRLEPVWEPVNLAMLEKFGPPRSLQQQKLASLLGRSSDARFWDFLEIPQVNRFRQWSMLYELNKHIAATPRKQLFYKLCSKQIRELTHWDDRTLVLIFDKFVLADSMDDEAMVYYYDLTTYQILQDGNRFNVFLNRPTMPSMSAREAVLSGGKFNIVSLQLDAINLLYARDFINEQLNGSKI